MLFVGLGLSQVMPFWLGDERDGIATAIRVLTMTGLAYIMAQVGFEFNIDKSNLRQYGWDYLVAFTAASTSAGTLFSMLAAAGLGANWMFRKARVLAIYEDLDNVLLLELEEAEKCLYLPWTFRARVNAA